jgi:hypothetical protein
VSRGESSTEGHVDFIGAISNDGSTVYFTAYDQLAPGASVLKEEEGGQVNLYSYDTFSKKTTYIAQVGGEEYPLSPGEHIHGGWYQGTALPFHHGRSNELAMDSRANWYATADGHYLVFVTYQAITGYDSTTAPGAKCERLVELGERQNCAEVYRYAAADHSIVCVSCGPPGVAQVDNAVFARSMLESPAGIPPRPVSENGNYVFFDSANALVPQATSGKVHVYEWHEGKISLISSVGDPGNAFFLGSSADGSNVFFGTHAQLAQQDTDISGDLYDARVGGGFGGLAPLACTGTGCQGVPAAPPIFATPASTTFEGTGNFPASQTPSMKPKGLTRAQKLARALKACTRDKSKRRRARCETRARKQYGAAHKSTKSSRRAK